MGLDITAYEFAVPDPSIGNIDELEDHEIDDMWEADYRWASTYEPSFSRSLSGLPEGWVKVSGKTFGFRAGSYSGYNSFRHALSMVMLDVDPRVIWSSPDIWVDSPFFELIHFSDCEGVIGPVAAANLAKDFHDNYDRAKDAWHTQNPYDNSSWVLSKYENWMEAFDLAADTGMVDFH